MAQPAGIFLSHSSDDAALAQAVAKALAARGARVLKMSGLGTGKLWQRELHEWMARCDAGLVLLTPAVQKRHEWVLKEAIILGMRLDLEPQFRLFFALSDPADQASFERCHFGLAQMAATQLMKTPAVAAQADALAAELVAQFPPVAAPSPFDSLIGQLKALLRQADAEGVTYATVAQHLGLKPAPAWGPQQLDTLAEQIARCLVLGRDEAFAIDELVVLLGSWLSEHRSKLVNLLVPHWVDAQAAGELRRHVPRPGAAAPAAVTIDGRHVPEFTAGMTVRRAYGLHTHKYRLAEAVGHGSDPFGEIRRDLCDWARMDKLVSPLLKKDDDVVAKLRDYPLPIFVPLLILPDAATLARLRDEFPRVLFLAPHVPGATGAQVLEPAPVHAREAAEHNGWTGALSAIQNS